MHISELNIYPVKSLRGFSVDSAELIPSGFKHDRQWMVVEPDGTFITQRSCPQMALVGTAMEDGRLVLSTFGMEDHAVPAVDSDSPRLRSVLWDDSVNAADTGEETAEWMTQALGIECRLVCFPTDEIRQCNLERANVGDHTLFADAYPLLAVSQASLDHLNGKLAQPVGMERFRPNIVVTGCDPHAEDDWKSMQADGVTLRVVKLCPRCSVPTVDPEAGVLAGPEPIHTLSSYRQWDGEIFFGVNLVPENNGKLNVGSEVLES